MKDLEKAFLSENAITSIDDDAFNFKHYAEKVKNLIQHNADNPEPIVIGIHGKWGEGKTSFLNLVERKIDLFEKGKKSKGILKFHFNPWRYSTEEEMLFDFFDALSKTMCINTSPKLKQAGVFIKKFGKYLRAVKVSSSVGVFGLANAKVSFEPSKIFEALGEDLEGENLTLETLKDMVNDALSKASYKILVIIDDIDRLDKNEIYTILKLIKLNANFKNFIYLVALDTQQVAKAIGKRYGKSEKDGLAFLEKIINIPIHLPRIEGVDLKKYFESKLNVILNLIPFVDKEKADKERNEILFEFRKAHFKTPREVIRVLNSFFISIYTIPDEINIRDLFWIEYIKIKNENCYHYLKTLEIDIFSNYLRPIIDFTTKINSEIDRRAELKKNYNNVSEVIDLLFPIFVDKGVYSESGKHINSDDANKGLKINHIEHFDKYFSYHLERKISQKRILIIKELISNKDETSLKSELKNYLKYLDGYNKSYLIEELIENLNEREGRDFLFEFLIENIDIIPFNYKDISGISFQHRVVELIGKVLSEEVTINEDLILKIADKIEISMLYYFIRNFEDNTSIKKGLEEKIVEKIEENVKKESKVFYKNISVSHINKMVMRYWRKHSEGNYLEYIKKSLENKENIKILVRNFAPRLNDNQYGGIDEMSYTEMSKLLDVNMLYKKIEENYPITIIKNNTIPNQLSDRDISSEIKNIEQFVYWYKKEKYIK
jgi:predicted KAP-like P-loop ATPase